MATSVVETRPAPLDRDDSYHFVVGPNQEAPRSTPSRLEVDMRTSPAKPARPDKTEESSAPQHPIPFMQDAFAESLFEATFGGKIPKPKLRAGDAKTRRAELLDQEKSDPPLAALWRYRPGQVNHELRRLIAQISFGVYLLLNGMANSQALVVSILQGHIDEVDEFLETTLEDMGLATKDLQDRIAHLKLPMDNMSVFETMLEDQKFRHQILDGNLKIDHIVGRTQVALQQTVQDLAEGVSSTREFSIYLAEQEDGPWRRDRPDVIDIYNAMKGNTDGWFNAFIDLQAQASTLNGLVVRLNGMVAEMDRTAAMVSQRVMVSFYCLQMLDRLANTPAGCRCRGARANAPGCVVSATNAATYAPRVRRVIGCATRVARLQNPERPAETVSAPELDRDDAVHRGVVVFRHSHRPGLADGFEGS